MTAKELAILTLDELYALQDTLLREIVRRERVIVAVNNKARPLQITEIRQTTGSEEQDKEHLNR